MRVDVGTAAAARPFLEGIPFGDGQPQFGFGLPLVSQPGESIAPCRVSPGIGQFDRPGKFVPDQSSDDLVSRENSKKVDGLAVSQQVPQTPIALPMVCALSQFQPVSRLFVQSLSVIRACNPELPADVAGMLE